MDRYLGSSTRGHRSSAELFALLHRVSYLGEPLSSKATVYTFDVDSSFSTSFHAARTRKGRASSFQIRALVTPGNRSEGMTILCVRDA